MANKYRRRKNRSKETYRTYVSDHQVLLRQLLAEKKFSDKLIRDVIYSGYAAMKADTTAGYDSMHVTDGFYGSKTYYGLMPFDFFCKYLEESLDKRVFPNVIKQYKVSSLKEATQCLNNDFNAPFFSAGEMTFRGQTNRYYTKRLIPNPAARSTQGEEELILASYWRQYLDSIINRPHLVKSSTTDAFFSDPLLRRYLPNNVKDILDGFESYGYRLPDEFGVWGKVDDRTIAEKYTDEIMPRTGYIRYSDEGRLLRQLPTIQQHYGIKTAGLDITFDLSVACFFALNSFSYSSNGKCYFQRKYENINPVVYCFVFHDPPIIKTLDITSSFSWFKDLEPIRPIRQNCALLGTDSFSINVAKAEIGAILELDPNFDDTDLPKPNYLFPSADEDPFYAYLLEKKKVSQLWKDIVEYDFSS